MITRVGVATVLLDLQVPFFVVSPAPHAFPAIPAPAGRAPHHASGGDKARDARDELLAAHQPGASAELHKVPRDGSNEVASTRSDQIASTSGDESAAVIANEIARARGDQVSAAQRDRKDAVGFDLGEIASNETDIQRTGVEVFDRGLEGIDRDSSGLACR